MNVFSRAIVNLANRLSAANSILGYSIHSNIDQVHSITDWVNNYYGADVLNFSTTFGYGGISTARSEAMSLAPFRRGVVAISGAIGSAPLLLLDGNGKEIIDHPILKVLRSPSGTFNTMTTERLITGIVQTALIEGNAFIRVKRTPRKKSDGIVGDDTRAREVQALEIVPNERIGCQFKANGIVSFKINMTDSPYDFDQAKNIRTTDLFHLTSNVLTPDGLFGVPTVVTAYNIIQSLKEIDAAQRAFLAGRFRGFVMPERIETWNQEDVDKFDSNINNAESNKFIFSSRRVSVIDGAKDTGLFSSYSAGREVLVRELARHFDAPPNILYEMGGTTWGSGLGEQSAAFATRTLIPFARKIEANLDRVLLSLDERDAGLHFELDFSYATRGSQTQMVNDAMRLVVAGIININEARRLLPFPLPPVDGGDEMRIPANLMGVEQLVGDTPEGDKEQKEEESNQR